MNNLDQPTQMGVRSIPQDGDLYIHRADLLDVIYEIDWRAGTMADVRRFLNGLTLEGFTVNIEGGA